ncbi:MAG TPA: aminotransferase class IV [Planctomycetaceae bacterium]|nr:aminotransferase class IV [Planctomycetaceae bacterium]
MVEPLAYLNGELVPFSAAKLPVSDMGLVHGASVTEMSRTFRRVPFRLDAHLDRLFRSLAVVGFKIGETRERLREISEQLIAHNAHLLPPGGDLGIVQFVTAGINPTYAGAAARRTPTVCVHTFPLPFELWRERLRTGQHLVTPALRHIPPECFDPHVKSRSRLFWIVADELARHVDPRAQALLLDVQGHLTETAAGNLFVVREGELRTPTCRNTLEGISRAVVLELAQKLNLRARECDLQLEDALSADEVFTTSTPYCLLPVTHLNGRPIGAGTPGPIVQQLLAAWSELVGCDIVKQMQG